MKKIEKEQESQNERVSTAFFIMPAEALKTLRHELEPLANEMAIKAILYRYGFRSGEACVQSMGIEVKGQKKIPDFLPSLWEEIGLSRLNIKKSKEGGYTLELNESIEANVNGDVGQASCDFTRGYLAGMVSSISEKGYHCREKKCLSKGDSHCTFFLTERVEGGET
ncbi:MAG: hypothetical protein JSW00_10195 [Thermoplasmata archaeon]|nr:MAG: hypothetical protein JSW00_10195 [Thermoplasmata archaeon]